MSELFLEKFLPKMSKEQLESAFNQLVVEANKECEQLAKDDPMAMWNI